MERWVVDISEWDPSPQDFSFALSVLPPFEQSSVTRKRALVSRLLQYALVYQVLAIPYDQIVIKRTLEGKPYLECGEVFLKFPNFNFNVSHHGDYVAIASEPLCLVGVDIVSIVVPQDETVIEFLQSFSSYFSSFEWHNIYTAGTTDDMLIEFYRYWCLKEAFVKAIGSGLAFDLDKVEFHHSCWTNIFVNVEGKAMKEWRFWLLELGKNHLMDQHDKRVAEFFPRLPCNEQSSSWYKWDRKPSRVSLPLKLRIKRDEELMRKRWEAIWELEAIKNQPKEENSLDQ